MRKRTEGSNPSLSAIFYHFDPHHTGVARISAIRYYPRGEMPERSNGAVSKTVECASAPGVRIPLSPPC
jgi:hypothetical protein